MSKQPKTFGRGPARRYLTRMARESGLKILRRRGKTWWFIKPSGLCNIVCMRFGNYTLRNLEPVRLKRKASVML